MNKSNLFEIWKKTVGKKPVDVQESFHCYSETYVLENKKVRFDFEINDDEFNMPIHFEILNE